MTQRTDACVSRFSSPGIQMPSAGGPLPVRVQTDVPDCVWFVEAFPTWVGLPTPIGGIGPAFVGFTVMPNLAGPARSTDLSFSGALLHVDQSAPACLFSVSPTDVNMPANGGSGSFQVTGVGTDCVYTAVSSDTARLRITSGASGAAPATVGFTVTPNVLPDNTWSVQVQNAFFKIHQNGAPIRRDNTSLNMAVALGPNGIRLQTGPIATRITNNEQPNADFAVIPDKSWAVVTPSSGQTPAVLSVDVDPVQAALLTSGFYTSNMKLTTSIAPVSPTFLSLNLRVYGIGETWQPFGVFETPLNGATYSGAIPVTGWALDAFGIAEGVAVPRFGAG